MTTHLLRLLLACSAATGCLSAQAPTDAAATKPPAAERSSGMKVGVVDLGRILADYPRSIEARKKIDELKVEFQKQIDEMTKRVDDARLLRDSYQRGTREFYEQDLAVKVQLQLVEGRSKILESELRRKQDEFLVLMLDDMKRAIAIVAKEQGVALVVRVHEDLLDGSPEAKARVFETRIVWYAAEEIDLTPHVIKLLRVPLPPVEGDAPSGSGQPPASSTPGK